MAPLSLEDLREGNARRDAGFMSLFTECIDRMLEAEQELIRALQADTDATPNRPAVEAAQERRNRHRQAILDAIKGQLEGNSNLQIKYMELAQLTPPTMVIPASVVKPEPFMTITVDEEMNVTFIQDFDADWEKVKAAMQAVATRMEQQFRDQGQCPFAPIDNGKG